MKEIERKFLVTSRAWKRGKGVAYRQGYLSSTPERTVRVRLAGKKAFLTVKGKGKGITRPEFEYPIPLRDAAELLAMCERPLIEKTRYRVKVGKHVWEVDDFHGDNAGLVVAEIELKSEREQFVLPAWAGKEVSADPRYLNSRLAKVPFKSW